MELVYSRNSLYDTYTCPRATAEPEAICIGAALHSNSTENFKTQFIFSRLRLLELVYSGNSLYDTCPRATAEPEAIAWAVPFAASALRISKDSFIFSSLLASKSDRGPGSRGFSRVG